MKFIKHITVEDHEPLSESELAHLEASKADIEAGRVYTWEEVEHRLANLPWSWRALVLAATSICYDYIE